MEWDAAQYLKFGDERTRAARDLLAHLPILSPKCIFGLGCGPGNSMPYQAVVLFAAMPFNTDMA